MLILQHNSSSAYFILLIEKEHLYFWQFIVCRLLSSLPLFLLFAVWI